MLIVRKGYVAAMRQVGDGLEYQRLQRDYAGTAIRPIYLRKKDYVVSLAEYRLEGISGRVGIFYLTYPRRDWDQYGITIIPATLYLVTHELSIARISGFAARFGFIDSRKPRAPYLDVGIGNMGTDLVPFIPALADPTRYVEESYPVNPDMMFMRITLDLNDHNKISTGVTCQYYGDFIYRITPGAFNA